MLKQSGWKTHGKPTDKKKKKGPALVPVIPISGWMGDNLIEPSKKMPWFKNWTATAPNGVKYKGQTLFQCFDQFVQPVERKTGLAMRMPVSGVFKMAAGTVITGRIEQGDLKAQVKTKVGMSGNPVKFYPSGLEAKVFSIEAHHRNQTEAQAGDNIGICVRGLPKDRLPKVGEIMALASDKTMGKTESFTANVKIQDHPGKLKVGYTPLVLVRTAKAACKITKILWKVTKANLKIIKKKSEMEDYKEKDPKFIQKGDTCCLEFTPQLPIAVSAYKDCEGLGRIAVLESNSLVMLGKIQTCKTVALKE
jgi:elongation factor 1-alpha